MAGVGPSLPATRKAPAAEAGAGTGRLAEGNPPEPLAPSRRAEIKAIPRHHRPPLGGLKSAASTTAATLAAATTPAPPAVAAAVPAAASATETFQRSQGRRRGAYIISVSPSNSRTDARGPNHGAGLKVSIVQMSCWRMQGPRRKRMKKQNGSMTCCWKSAWRRKASGWTSCRIGLRGVAAGEAARGGTGAGLPTRNGRRTPIRAEYSVAHRKETK